MARDIRVKFAWAFYHVMARGNRRQDIFSMMRTAGFSSKPFRMRASGPVGGVHAWVLMNNHYHLLIETPEPNLVEGMKWLQNTYTRRLNTKHRLWGRVFGDRYKAVLVEGERVEYFTALLRLSPQPGAGGGCECGERRQSQGLSLEQRADGLCDQCREATLLVMREGGIRGVRSQRLGFSGRREFLERLDRRAREEQEAAGVVPVPETRDARLSHLRRGWYWGGSRAFSEKALALGRRLIESRRNASYRSGLIFRTRNAQEAERILKRGLKRFRLPAADLEKASGSDVRKVALAELLGAKTSMSQAWIASELRMKSTANVSQQLRRIRSSGGARRKGYKTAKGMLSDIFD
ncbi:MAG: transposase [Verrucomicrobiaceae bacterium]|nr:MAG: transposase [Verrucomicrobiaceae bacterium]